MNLQNVFDQLIAGELRTAFLGELVEGEIPEDRKKTFLIHLNMGLNALHQRFLLKERFEVVNLTPEKYRYRLEAKDLLRIEAVRDLADNEYLLNILNDPESLHTPDHQTLDIPKNLQEENDVHALQVFYRAKHPELPVTALYLPPNMVQVDLPEVFLEALVYFMASRILNPVGMTNEFHEGNNYAQKYEMVCQRLELGGFGIQQDYVQDQFRANGWV